MTRASLLTSWMLMRQRPHHLVEVLNALGAAADVFSIGNFRGRGDPASPPNTFRHLRLMPSQIVRVPGAARLDRNRTARMVRAFAEAEGILHVYAAAPVVALPRKPARLVYDCLDDWSSFPGAPAAIERFERELCEIADRIWASSRRIEARLSARYPGKVSYVPNGVDFEHFVRARRSPRAGRRPVLGYIGAIDAWFDEELVAGVARRLSGWDIVLVGPRAKSVCASMPTNVRLAGRRPYLELPAFLSRFDVAMIPFRVNELTRSTNPCKLYEYLASGLGVVSTPLDEVRAFEEPGVVACAGEPARFAEAVEKMAAAETDARRREIARGHGWRARFEPALRELGVALGDRAEAPDRDLYA